MGGGDPGPAVASPSKSNPIPGEWGERSHPAPVSEATLQTRDPKPLSMCLRDGHPCPCSPASSPPVGSQLPVVELCSTTRTRWAKRRQGQVNGKAKHRHLPAVTNTALTLRSPSPPCLTCTPLRPRCLGQPESASPPALLSKFGVKHIKTFPYAYRFPAKTPPILPSGSFNGVFLPAAAVGFSAVVKQVQLCCCQANNLQAHG